jgi:K+-sensing histidine kinase KdpD
MTNPRRLAEQIETPRMRAEHDVFPQTLALFGHELSTPLSVASGYVRMLLREQGGPLTEKQRKMLEEADHSCKRIETLLLETREFRRLLLNEIPLGRQRFDLAALVNEVASGMHEGRDRDVTLEVRGSERVLEVIGDRKWIGNAVRTLLHASLRESDRQTVIAECRAIAGERPAAQLAVGGPSAIEALNEAGDARGAETRFDGWRGGYGMTFRVTRWVVEAHGGVIWSTPHPDKLQDHPGWSAGTAFRIPLAA